MSLEHSPARQNAVGAQPFHSVDPLYDEIVGGIYIGGADNPISPRTMQRWRHTGTGPAWIRVGRLIRYKKSSLDAFLAAGEQRPAA